MLKKKNNVAGGLGLIIVFFFRSDIVMSKQPGNPMWPARVVLLPGRQKKSQYQVEYFGYEGSVFSAGLLTEFNPFATSKRLHFSINFF